MTPKKVQPQLGLKLDNAKNILGALYAIRLRNR